MAIAEPATGCNSALACRRVNTPPPMWLVTGVLCHSSLTHHVIQAVPTGLINVRNSGIMLGSACVAVAEIHRNHDYFGTACMTWTDEGCCSQDTSCRRQCLKGGACSVCVCHIASLDKTVCVPRKNCTIPFASPAKRSTRDKQSCSGATRSLAGGILTHSNAQFQGQQTNTHVQHIKCPGRR